MYWGYGFSRKKYEAHANQHRHNEYREREIVTSGGVIYPSCENGSYYCCRNMKKLVESADGCVVLTAEIFSDDCHIYRNGSSVSDSVDDNENPNGPNRSRRHQYIDSHSLEKYGTYQEMSFVDIVAKDAKP